MTVCLWPVPAPNPTTPHYMAHNPTSFKRLFRSPVLLEWWYLNRCGRTMSSKCSHARSSSKLMCCTNLKAVADETLPFFKGKFRQLSDDGYCWVTLEPEGFKSYEFKFCRHYVTHAGKGRVKNEKATFHWFFMLNLTRELMGENPRPVSADITG